MDSIMVDEWGSEARYAQVLQAFGNVSPFKQLRTTNSKRTTALLRVYVQYGALPPENPYRTVAAGYVSNATGEVARYESPEAACELFVSREREVVARYDRLLDLAPPRPVATVAERNRSLSVENDIPAAERCR